MKPERLFIFFLFLSGLSSAPPLRIPIKITGSFGEYRNDHLHAGVDLSTYASTGHDVLAIKEGWLYRIKKRDTGEGNTVYLKHPDKTISVYAHLEDFSPKIEAFINQKKPFDIFPDTRISFEEGEVLGYTGESGRGFPHLHLEIRSKLSKALDNSMFIDGIKDRKSPVITNIELIPILREGDRINVEIKDNSPVEVEVPYPVGIAIEGYDLFDSSQAKCHIPEWKIFDSKDLIYHSRMKTIQHTRNYASAMHFIRDSTNLSPTRYLYKLYRDFTQQSPFILKAKNNGILGPGLHKIRIEGLDFHGNSQEILLSIKVRDSPVPKIKTYNGKHLFRKGPFELNLQKDGVSVDARVRLTLLPLDFLKEKSPLLGLEIAPDYLFFTKKASLQYKTPVDGKEYFLRWNPVEKNWEPALSEKAEGVLKTSITLPGKYLVARDTNPPSLDTSIQTLKAKRKTFYYIGAEDKESGIDPKSLDFQCNSNTLEAEFDPDRKWIRWSSIPCLSAQINLCDRVGNCLFQAVGEQERSPE